MRVVLDTGVFVSAAITPRGVAAEVVARGLAGDYELVVSARLLRELAEVLDRTKFRMSLSVSQVDRFLVDINAGAVHADDPAHVPQVTRDPDDDYLVALARVVRADLLVTGDRDLLDQGDSEPPAVTPRVFLTNLQGP